MPKALVDKAREVVEANRKAGRRIAIAESCTGGLVSRRHHRNPGLIGNFRSRLRHLFERGQDRALNVSEDLVETFGAVSVAVAWAMARGALLASEADVAVAITGIAGPGGGTPSKPVGTVVFARAERDARPGPDRRRPEIFRRDGRSGVRLQAALCALELLMP